MEERNAQIEKEDEEKKAEELKERKRKVLGMLSKIKSLGGYFFKWRTVLYFFLKTGKRYRANSF